MTYFDTPEISRLPFGQSPKDFYDIVYVGRAILDHNSDLAQKLQDYYVFLFTTAFNQEVDSCTYGHVRIDLVKQEYLSYFNRDIMKRARHHVYTGGTLEINPFLSIVEEEDKHSKQIIAHLKKQKILKNYHENEVKYIRDFKVLLIRDNGKNEYNNLPVLELGPEFQARLDYDWADERKKYLQDGLFVLTSLSNDYEGKPEQSTIKETISLLKRKIDEASRKKKEAFEHYLQIRAQNSYYRKRID
ncbi:hypothetical protein [Parageobacillus thermoglucosidasius]|uniref:Uncharacterized protein n=1 Tax=Parageobacillus thermoglucosidasius TaxID=1426 RepID=A0AB38R656_PARTM|nr:hypothetical protein [Parageobacillus thermoglucosidasius]UOE78290.1 hypothetical protein IMI45_19880 [Parageobacillus thermoglucosidasius]